MYDKLISALREAHEYAMEWGENPFRYAALYKKAADAIEELQGRVKTLTRELDEANQDADYANEAATALYGALPRWIPVTERLPEEAGKYLACGRWRGKPTEIWVCEFMSLGCLKGWANGSANPIVSHWMPLPQTPKEE